MEDEAKPYDVEHKIIKIRQDFEEIGIDNIEEMCAGKLEGKTQRQIGREHGMDDTEISRLFSQVRFMAKEGKLKANVDLELEDEH